MFRKLKIKFILIATLSMFLVLGIVLALVNFVSYRSMLESIFSTLELLSDYSFIPAEEDDLASITDSDSDKYETLKNIITPETKYEVRYFSITLDQDDEIVNVNDENIAAIDDDDYANIVSKISDNTVLLNRLRSIILYDDSDRGIIVYNSIAYAYIVKSLQDGCTKITFMDCTSRMAYTYFFSRFSMIIGLISMLLLICVLSFFAKKAVAPISKNIEAQKRFITNASHELKTPLAVISANTEVIEMINGKSEWTESTVKQVNKMSDLISRLVVLSKLEEAHDIVMTEVNLSKEALDVADSFRSVAETSDIMLVQDIEDDVIINSDEHGAHELVSILVDNAVKYCDEGGNVTLSLHKRGKGFTLAVSNTYKEGKGVDYSRFFDRFYREDESHNSEKKGYGIGLSMAESLCSKFKWKITVTYKEDTIYFTVTG